MVCLIEKVIIEEIFFDVLYFFPSSLVRNTGMLTQTISSIHYLTFNSQINIWLHGNLNLCFLFIFVILFLNFFYIQSLLHRTSIFQYCSHANMSLACLVCHGVESPSHSFRSYSVSSSDNEGRCSAIANCLPRKTSLPHPRANFTSSKVMPQPTIPSGVTGAPRLVRSHAVRRDIVRDWNFDEIHLER